MTQLTSKPLNWFKVNPQVRKFFDEEELRQLGESMKAHGQLQPVLARPDGTLIAGERRWRAAQLAGLKELQVIITEKPLSDTEIRLIQLTENLHRADLSDAEVYRAVQELWALNPTWLKKDLAAHLHKDASMVTRILCVDELVPAAREAFLAGSFGFSKAYTICKTGSEQGQQHMLAALLSGTSRDEGERQVRQQRNAQAPAVRVSRIKCPLPSGATVQVSGEGISLDDAIEATQEALKALKKAREDGLDSKTAQAVFRDKAKVR